MKDDTAAGKVLEAYKTHTPARRRGGRGGGRGQNCGRGRGDGGRGGGSARRATSADRVEPNDNQSTAPVPPPPPQQQSQQSAATANPFGILANQYVDNDEIPTDLDDAAAGGFDADFAAEGNNNSNTSSANYSVASARRVSVIPHSLQSQVTAHANHACRRLPILLLSKLFPSPNVKSPSSRQMNKIAAPKMALLILCGLITQRLSATIKLLALR